MGDKGGVQVMKKFLLVVSWIYKDISLGLIFKKIISLAKVERGVNERRDDRMMIYESQK